MKLAEFSLSSVIEDQPSVVDQVKAFNQTASNYPRERTVHAQFSLVARKHPEAVAVVGEDGTEYSYGRLESDSNRLARLLIDCGATRESVVGILLTRGYEVVLAVLATLKAGAAYLPLETAAPFERMERLLKDTDCGILLTERAFVRRANRLQWECRLGHLLCLDSDDFLAESEGVGQMMEEALWDQVGRDTFDDISGGGWRSSYTGEWLSRAVMDEYGDNILRKLEPYLSPDAGILEVACGSGISLLRLAPKVARYYATDLSGEILGWTQRVASEQGLTNVTFRNLPAHETHKIDQEGFQIAIMNSVIQCFSGPNYFRQVLRQTLDRMADDGVIFLGNLWDLDLKPKFVESLRAYHQEHRDEGARTKLDRSEEFFVSREFLEDLRHDFPEIADIETSGMLGDQKSELREYGYDAILKIRKRDSVKPVRSRRRHQLDQRHIRSRSDAAFPERTDPQGLAYVCHTSGTTGEPKGAMITHQSIMRLVLDTNHLQLTASDRVLQTGSLAFDASTFEIWGPLLNGASFFRPPALEVLVADRLKSLIREYGVTTMWLTSSLLNQLIDADITVFEGLRHLLTGGEKLSPTHLNRIRRRHPHLMLINGYGPTENTTFTTCHPIAQEYLEDIPIGKPVANTDVVILDASGKLCPSGVNGEICTGGDGLARGYLRDPSLTAFRFVPHPLKEGERMYRTGDLGRWNAAGYVEFMGRLDDQVKIRGFRVEPGEVEAALRAEPGVEDAVVLAKEGTGGSRMLVAYVTGRNLDAGSLRGNLRGKLPEYMVPTHCLVLPGFPLTPSGKLDRAALPAPELETRADTGRLEPANDTERMLAAIWEQVLARKGIGMDENFFDAGGHSLYVAKVVAEIQQRMGICVPISAIFRHATIESLALAVQDAASFGVDLADEVLVRLSPSGAAVKLFAFAPGTGDAAGYIQLAQGLKSVVFHAFNFVPDERLAQRYADLVLETDPEGPYTLFGYSSGGNMAFHVAKELEDRNRKVRHIIMVDAGRKLEVFEQPRDVLEEVIDSFLQHESNAPYVANPVLRDKAVRLVRASYRHFEQTVDRHEVRAPISVLRCEGGEDEHFGPDGSLISTKPGWAEATSGGFSMAQAFGGHNDMLSPPALEKNLPLIEGLISKY